MHLGVELHLHSDYLSAYTAQYPGVPTCRARKHLQACWGGLSFCCKLLQEVMLHCLDHLRCIVLPAVLVALRDPHTDD